MLDDIGISADDVRLSNGYENLNQCIMRTSLRDRESTSDVTLYVPTEAEARYLQELYNVPDSNIEFVEGVIETIIKPVPLNQVSGKGCVRKQGMCD